ncbi:hypothetical protein C8Q79DRAFT_729822 [Trametes meyenii]|nr:hypothetical protein C8Q79DRAFT_729822 [Trametes meyenii]
MIEGDKRGERWSDEISLVLFPSVLGLVFLVLCAPFLLYLIFVARRVWRPAAAARGGHEGCDRSPRLWRPGGVQIVWVVDPQMATRQNKKRKGRGNAPPRERTVTTLTDGPEGSFQPSPQLPDIEEPTSAALLSPPFSVSSPLTAGPSPALSASPYLSSFSAPFSYSFNMPPVAAPPFQPQRASPQFFPPPPQPIPQSVPAQQPALSGQSDLEILERLKETIKNNQHAIFRPIPRPDALLSVYLGPKTTASYHVPPHPEQVPTDVSPPGLTLPPPDSAKASNDTSATASLNQFISRASQIPHNDARGSARRASVSESPKNNTTQSGKRSVNQLDSSPSFPGKTTTLVDKHDSINSSPPMTPGPQKLVQTNGTRSSPGKGVRSEDAQSSVVTGEPFSTKLSSAGKEDSRARDVSRAPRSSFEDRQQRPDPDRSGRSVVQSPRMSNTGVSGATTGNGPRSSPKDQSVQDRDRERERDKERESDRDRGRPLPPRDEPNRFRDDRRNDDRPRDNRRASPDTRRYESRYPPRRHDSKASDSSFTSPRLVGKSPPQPRPTRNLGEERAIVRPPLDATASRPPPPEERRIPADSTVDDRGARPLIDDRRGAGPLVSASDRQTRNNDDRRLLPPPPVDRLSRSEDRRPLPAPAPDRSVSDDRRRPLSPTLSDRLGRPVDDRRGPAPPSPALSTSRSARPVDDRRPAPPAGERHVPAPSGDDRRPAAPATTERAARPAPEDRRTVPLEERISRAPVSALPDSVLVRPAFEERGTRTADEKHARSPVPLEDRISRAPSLQERLSHPPVKPDDRPVPRLEERLSRPANAPPSLEERLSTPAIPDGRPTHSHSDDRPPRPVAPIERSVPRPADERSVLTEPARVPPPVERSAPRVEERVFTPAERYTRPATPVGSDRGHAAPAPTCPYLREFRPAVETRDRPDTRLSYPAPAGPEPDRYASERRPAPTPASAPELMDVDTVHPRERVVERRMSYRRPSPPLVDSYPSRDRAWVPAGEAYREPEPTRRAVADHAYTRDWREGERPYGDDWNERTWDRSREYDRDARFVERDAVPPAWETREERERRAAYPEVPPTSTRVYERTLGSRLSDPYPDDRAYLDRGRFVESAPTYSRIRPRSPSPIRRAPGSDDLRPPVKRAREDPYAPAPYYADEPPRGGPVDYPPRMRSPPPPPSGAYYDDPRYPPSPGTREREYLDSRDPGYPPYDRRTDPGGRMPLPRSPPPYSRASAYGREDRRY